MHWRVAFVAMLLLACGCAWISRRWSPTARAGLSGALGVIAGLAIGAHFLIVAEMQWDEFLAVNHIDAVTHRTGLVGPAQLVLLLACGTALAAGVASRRARAPAPVR